KHRAQRVRARVDRQQNRRRKDCQQRGRGEAPRYQERDERGRAEEKRDGSNHEYGRIAEEMDDEVIERRPGVVVQRVKNPAERLTGDPAREELVEKRLAHEEEDQAWNKKQRGDSNGGALQLVVVNKSRKL